MAQVWSGHVGLQCRVILSVLLIISTTIWGSRESSSFLKRLSWSYQFKPLIGGPRFVPIHISTRVTIGAHNKARKAPGILLDFVPADDNVSVETTRALISGASIQGKLRMTCDGGNGDSEKDVQALRALGNELLHETQRLWGNDELELNLYKANCYHLAFHLTRVLIKETAKVD